MNYSKMTKAQLLAVIAELESRAAPASKQAWHTRVIPASQKSADPNWIIQRRAAMAAAKAEAVKTGRSVHIQL
jgi:hypothetical protein